MGYFYSPWHFQTETTQGLQYSDWELSLECSVGPLPPRAVCLSRGSCCWCRCHHGSSAPGTSHPAPSPGRQFQAWGTHRLPDFSHTRRPSLQTHYPHLGVSLNLTGPPAQRRPPRENNEAPSSPTTSSRWGAILPNHPKKEGRASSQPHGSVQEELQPFPPTLSPP